MKLIFVGTGSAFTVGDGNYQSNMLIVSDTGKILAIDCGTDFRMALYEVGYSYRDIDAVYVSHQHADHIGGLEWLAFSTFFDPKASKPNLYAKDLLIKDLWDKSLSGGLSSLQDELATLSTYFNVHSIEGLSFMWDGITFNLFKTQHVACHAHPLPSYGLSFNANGVKVMLTTDVQFVPETLIEHLDDADIIFHDCETAAFKSGVHAHYSELVTLDPKYKRKMWLYHYQPGPLPDASQEQFLGFVKKGQIFDFPKNS